MLTKAKVLDVSEDRLPSVMQALLRDSPNIALAVILSMHLLRSIERRTKRMCER
jgi:hypothetical protein